MLIDLKIKKSTPESTSFCVIYIESKDRGVSSSDK